LVKAEVVPTEEERKAIQDKAKKVDNKEKLIIKKLKSSYTKYSQKEQLHKYLHLLESPEKLQKRKQLKR